MKTKRAILLGIAIWVIAILFYSATYFLAPPDIADILANIILFVVVMPLVWTASSFYYKKDHKTHGYLVGQTMLLTAVALDALITVPFLVIPQGGSHFDFFTSIGFWIIAVEFLVVAALYWYIRVAPRKINYSK